ncbi:MAG: replicative DNA helicase [Clostridiales bacterium]|jgi:replicative DNA helicase|nr:replicative DNA helicase [Clostridiales bacterium]
MEIQERGVSPHSLPAEISVLGSMLLDEAAQDLCVEQLQAQDFFDPANQQIFACMFAMREKGAPVDSVTLLAELDRLGQLRAVGGAGYLSELLMQTYTAANVGQYSKVVRERSLQRRLINAGNAIARDGMSTEIEIEQMLNDAERRIYDITISKNDDTLVPIQSLLVDAYTQVEALQKNSGRVTGVPTGFIDLDSKTSGLKKSDLIIIAGRPTMGKTSFAINIAQHAALREGRTVAIFSLEMAKEQLIMRMFSTEAHVDLQRILTGRLDNEETVSIALQLENFEKSKLFIDDNPNASVPAIRSKCRRLKARHGLDLIVIDYLQLMRASGKSENRQQEVSEITRSTKILARELDVPIVLLSQLSRAPEQRKDDHRPMLSDLRESGAIEQDADIVMLLYREQVYDDEADNVAEIIIAKHRNGPIGTVKLCWLGEYTKFDNLSYAYDY